MLEDAFWHVQELHFCKPKTSVLNDRGITDQQAHNE